MHIIALKMLLTTSNVLQNIFLEALTSKKELLYLFARKFMLRNTVNELWITLVCKYVIFNLLLLNL